MQKSEQTFVTVKGKIRRIRPAPPLWFKLNLTHYPYELLSMLAFGRQRHLDFRCQRQPSESHSAVTKVALNFISFVAFVGQRSVLRPGLFPFCRLLNSRVRGLPPRLRLPPDVGAGLVPATAACRPVLALDVTV